jgi:hypothetical protein
MHEREEERCDQCGVPESDHERFLAEERDNHTFVPASQGIESWLRHERASAGHSVTLTQARGQGRVRPSYASYAWSDWARPRKPEPEKPRPIRLHLYPTDRCRVCGVDEPDHARFIKTYCEPHHFDSANAEAERFNADQDQQLEGDQA